MILELIEQAETGGATFDAACSAISLSARTVRRWRDADVGDDQRAGPHKTPAHALTPAERARIVEVATSAEFRDLSPKQIVPRLADRGIYLASESTFYRVLHDEKLIERLEHRRDHRVDDPRDAGREEALLVLLETREPPGGVHHGSIRSREPLDPGNGELDEVTIEATLGVSPHRAGVGFGSVLVDPRERESLGVGDHLVARVVEEAHGMGGGRVVELRARGVDTHAP